jgi:hypothetical protein
LLPSSRFACFPFKFSKLIACRKTLPVYWHKIFGIIYPFKSVTMNNAAPRRLYEDGDLPKQLAPIIPIKPAKKVSPKAAKKIVAVKTDTQVSFPAPAFTAPVFKPRRHDML